MIYTVTFNPSIDYICRAEHFVSGKINRTTYEKFLPGGKGINVSIVLKNLGIPSRALGFVAGFTGKEIQHSLQAYGVENQMIEVREGLSRINVKMKSDDETEINGQGPKIHADEIQQLFEQLDCLNKEDLLVISGSVPHTLPSDMYEQIMERLSSKEIPIVVDAEKDLLKKVLKYHPFLIKPNNHELSELFQAEIENKEDCLVYAKKLQELGARNVYVSMASQGAVFLSEDGQSYQADAPKGTLINSVGAGDSSVAGFLSGYLKTKDMRFAFYQGICAGSASAFSEELATADQVKALMKSMNV